MGRMTRKQKQLRDDRDAARRAAGMPGTDPGGAAGGAIDREFSRLLANSLPGVVYLFDEVGSLLWWNRTMERATGYEAGELAGMSVLEFVLPDERDLVGRRMREVLERGKASVEGHLVAKSGTATPYFFNGHRIEFGGGPCLIGMGLDLTDLKRTERGLRLSEARKGAILEASLDCIITIDDDERILEFNPAAERTFGHRRAEVLGRKMSELIIPPALREAHRQGLRRFLETGHGPVLGRRVEMSAIRADGAEFPVEISIVGRMIEGRNIFTGYLRDITERREAEAALRVAADRFRALFDQSPQPMIIYAPDGTVRRGNPAFERLFGFTAEDMIRAGFRLLDDPQVISGGALPAIERAFGGEPTWGPAVHFRPGASFPSRNDVWVEALLCPLKDAAGGVTEVFAMLEDITDRRRSEEAIRQLNTDLETRVETRTAELASANVRLQTEIAERTLVEEELRAAKLAAERATKAKDEFLTMISHELRTPLNGVIGMVELLSDSTLDGRQRRYAEVARTSADVLLGVINDILDLSRIESGKLELDPVEFNPSEVVEEVASVLALRAEERGLELAFHARPEVDTWILGDRGRLQQVLTNLVANAIKFTERGEVVVHVELEGRRGDRTCLRFTVHDTGIGIAPDRLGQLFEPFTQADASTTRRYGGSGLGLAISRHLTHAMGGRIHAASVPGVGSTFSFTVVMETVDQVARPEADFLRSLAGARALIVDDNETNRQILLAQLAGAGMTCETATDGLEAMARLEAAARAGRPFEVAVLDLHMPGMNGEELCEAVKADPALTSVVLILLCSMTYTAAAADLRRMGFSGWATKPIGRLPLLRLIAASLSGIDPTRDQHPGPARSGSRPGDQPLSTPVRPLKVLVAEDSRANQLVTAGLLGKMGHEVVIANNGNEAIDAFRAGDFDLILMDVQMPLMDGLGASRTIREFEAPRGTRTPIVAVTAHAVKGDRERCLASGMDAYLSKPLRGLELARVIDGLCAGRPRDRGRPRRATLDRDRSLARLGGDEGLFAEVVDLHLVELADLLGAVRDAAGRGDARGVGSAAHRLCGLAGTFDAFDAAEAAAALEDGAATGDLSAVGLVELEFERLRVALEGLARGSRPARP
jgi:two-component system sensor histidine kinase/response regulator